MPYLGNPHIPPLFPLRGITALDGTGSEGLTRRQTYTVTEIRNGRRTPLFVNKKLIAVPSNAGPATFPNYPTLAIDNSPANNRTDLMNILLKYPNQPHDGTCQVKTQRLSSSIRRRCAVSSRS